MNEELDPNIIECPHCPVCGEETDTFYRRKDFVIVGCPECVDGIDAYESRESRWEPLLW